MPKNKESEDKKEKVSLITISKKALDSLFTVARISRDYEDLNIQLRKMERQLIPPEKLVRYVPLAPPKKPIDVWCTFCRKSYRSDEIKLEYRLRFRTSELEDFPTENAVVLPKYWCKNTSCRAYGFMRRIFPLDKRPKNWRKVYGTDPTKGKSEPVKKAWYRQ